MRTQARVVVVGGGIAGLSALYHLVQEGWTDVVLLERDELTSGTTWHSAAQCPGIAFNQLLLLLRRYTLSLYRELADDPDYPINYHYATGGLRLLTDHNQVDACHHIISVARGVGGEFELVDPAEALRLNPLLNTEGILAALWDPLDGDIDPAQLCQALARRCRNAGAEIHRHTPATAICQKAGSEWLVETPKGSINCEHLVVAAGYRANEVGKLIEVEYPIVAMEHMYFITKPIETLQNRDSRIAMVRCPRDTFYMRQEKQGLLVGVYEHDCKPFGLKGIDPDFVNALCPNDLDRCLPKLETIFDRVPVLQQVGIQSMVNGPITYAADAAPLVGPHPGIRNLWSMNGIRVGIGEGGGYGRMLAQMMVHGETEWDCWQLDPRRITCASQAYTAAKSIEDYQNEFRWHLPHEHRPAGRPLKTTPLYPMLKQQHAAFDVVNGWERASFFAPNAGFEASHGYRFQNWHEIVEKEVKGISSSVGIAELSGFNSYLITGTHPWDWLDRLTCSRMPNAFRKAGLCYFLNHHGNILCEAVLVRLDENTVWYGSAATAQWHDRDWLTSQLPDDGSIKIREQAETHTPLVLAGPDTRRLLSSLAPELDWSTADFAMRSCRLCDLGYAEAMALALSYSGEDAVELHVSNHQLVGLYQSILSHGKSLGLVHFGMYAIDSMRLEMGYGHWKSDYITEFNPLEAGLESFVDFNKAFIGKAALLKQKTQGHRRRRVLLTIDCYSAPAQPGESVFHLARPVGTITSAGWGYRTRRNIAMAYIDPDLAVTGTTLEVMLLGDRFSAKVVGSRIMK